MKKLFNVSIVIALFALLIWGCEKKKDEAPSLPPLNTMTIDFSNFSSVTKSSPVNLKADADAKGTNANWSLAATTAGLWNVLLTINLVVPVAAFEKAIDNAPVYLENKKWEWKYSVNVVGATYNARLTGEVLTNDVKWEMYISKDGVGAFEEFLWFSGTSALDGKSGQWILNLNQTFQEPFLQIDWSLTGTKIGSIKYTYIRDLKDDRSTDLFKTSFIEYGLTTDALDAFYNIHYNASTTTDDFQDVYIEWSTTDHNGHIKAVNYYQDSDWHCWDSTGSDISCN